MSDGHGGGMVQRASGIVVPADLETAPAPLRADRPARPAVAYDPDGRRRVVLDRSLQREIDALVRALHARGLAMVVACVARDDDTAPCRGVLLNEATGTPDAGYGCGCTRIHFR